MLVSRVEAKRLDNIPIQPPPFRSTPSRASVIVIEVETASGLIGWALAGGHARPELVDFVNYHVAPKVVGEDARLTRRVWYKITRELSARDFGRQLILAVSAIDIALWDLKGQILGQPVHMLLGGTTNQVPVYVTHGAAYGGDPRYSTEELVAEAKYLAEHGNKHLKNVVGRQDVPNPDDDARRMTALRDALGDEIRLSMDGNGKMSASQALRLCKLTEDLNIAFIEEPVYDNDPKLLGELRRQTHVPVAAAQNHMYSARQLVASDAVDIIQPNVGNDGGYTGALAIADMARAFNVPLGHGNGSGPYNIALQAGVTNGVIVEYHFHRWMTYNAIFEKVPQPKDGYVEASIEPGTGLRPKDGLIKEFAASSRT